MALQVWVTTRRFRLGNLSLITPPNRERSRRGTPLLEVTMPRSSAEPSNLSTTSQPRASICICIPAKAPSIPSHSHL